MHSATEEVRSGDAGSGVLEVAVVSGPRTVRFIAAARDRAVLEERLADYVAGNANIQLFPQDAKRVHDLLAARDYAAAVELYFAAVGRRWDPEWLLLHTVQVEEAGVDNDGVSPSKVEGRRSLPFLGVF